MCPCSGGAPRGHLGAAGAAGGALCPAGLSRLESSPPCDSLHKKHPLQTAVPLADTLQPAYQSDERPSRRLIEKGMKVTTGLEMHSLVTGCLMFGLLEKAQEDES